MLREDFFQKITFQDSKFVEDLIGHLRGNSKPLYQVPDVVDFLVFNRLKNQNKVGRPKKSDVLSKTDAKKTEVKN